MAKETPCQRCDGKCCRYFALEIDEPTTRRDFDDIRWYLCHEGTRVFVEDGDWYLEIQSRCRHLGPDNRCRIYARRPAVCREHSTENCEGNSLEFDWDLEFCTDEDVARYMARRFPPRKKKARGTKSGRGGGSA
ncbi:MAG: YkgJ family cysteine cluster protein [Candidatus Brocadiia bacterium]